MQHTDKARAEFEAFATSKAFGLTAAHLEKTTLGEYVNYPTQCYWLVWQASRASVVVELPQPFEGDDFEMYDGAEMKAAIEAAGIPWKE